ncbi:hypothetical protein [Pseudalkalibacillus caeni]|uniref:Lipoprotein n=1 Tax=Exobacillus caeni TaxID=2574798 RepID=A0A5R9F0A5_9BACL|nr:hypothetical protein [Pseudalkalibacillus caeni]TLS36441.1 hypothetical protein FCL54_14540 [Pseudalkalibacillus caeni]
MKIIKLLFGFFSIIGLMTGCVSDEVDSPIYSGKNLNIGVIGKVPEVREQNVSFTNIEFEDLKTDLDKTSSDLDAIFIMKDHLSQAAESQYANIYKSLSIPTFFFETNKGYLPFVNKDMTYENSPKIRELTYATGYLQKEENAKYWAYGLYNDVVNETNVEDVYTRVFTTIDSL